MSEVKLGQLVDATAQRDAIHIAIAPVVAKDMLPPGQHIGFVQEGNTELVGVCTRPVGIVDPFLKEVVMPGQRFYMFMYPNTVTGLRHEWTHPAFGDELSRDYSDKDKAVLWLRWYAKNCLKPYSDTEDVAYQEMMGDLANGKVRGYGNDLYEESGLEHRDEFFRNLEIVLGRNVDRSELTYSCSC